MAPTKSSYTKSMSPLSAGGLPCSVTAQSTIPLCVRSLLRYPWCCQCLACALYVSRLAVNKLSESSPLLLDVGGGQRATSTKLSPTASWAKWLPTVSKKEKKPNEMQPENGDKTMRRMLMTLCLDCKVNSTKARVPLASLLHHHLHWEELWKDACTGKTLIKPDIKLMEFLLWNKNVHCDLLIGWFYNLHLPVASSVVLGHLGLLQKHSGRAAGIDSQGDKPHPGEGCQSLCEHFQTRN